MKYQLHQAANPEIPSEECLLTALTRLPSVMYVYLTCVPRIQNKIKHCFVSQGEHQMILSKKWIIRLQSLTIIQRKKGLRNDNVDVNWASLILIKENDFSVVH